MSGTKKKIYEALLEGATSGLVDQALFDYVVRQVPKANSRRIVRAALLALSDPALADRNILNVIYALAIKHRLADMAGGDEDDEPEAPSASAVSAEPKTAAGRRSGKS